MRTWVRRAIAAGLIVLVVFLAVRYQREILEFLGNRDQLQVWLEQLGPVGPLGLILVNAAQVVFAPIPGYVMQCAAGYLFGWLPGAVYGTVGMALGGLAAMYLARAFGRPLVNRIVGADRVARWEAVAHLDSIVVWIVLMLGFFGDVPYFIAGLTSLAMWKILAIALIVRTPSVFVTSAVCAGVVDVDITWRSPWMIGAVVVVIIGGLLVARYQGRIERWIDERLLVRAASLRSRADVPASDDQTPVGEG